MAALRHIVASSAYLASRPLFSGVEPEVLDIMQAEVFSRAFSNIEGRTELQAANTFRRIAAVLADDGDNWQTELSNARAFVQAFCADGLMLYTPARPTRQEGVSLPATYTVNPGEVAKSVIHLIQSEATVLNHKGLMHGSKHYQGALAMSAHPFRINGERYRTATMHLKQGEFLTRSGTWKLAATSKEKAKLEQQVAQAKAAHAVAWATEGKPYHWAVKCDRRGRMYYVAGMFSPQAGGIAEYVQTQEGAVDFDSTASFAQFIAVLTNDRALGEACNLLNYTGTPKDFYAEVFKQAVGKDAHIEKSSFERKTAKAYIMPKAYGAGDEACRNRTIELAEEEGFELTEVMPICDALAAYAALDTVKFAAAEAVEFKAKEGKQLAWVTPSGFMAEQAYWMPETHVWRCMKQAADYLPAQITFRINTDKVNILDRDAPDNGTKDARVAAAANIVQSLDAAFLARAVAAYYEKTGRTVKACHDSVQFADESEVETFKAIAWVEFCDMARGPEMQAMRKMLGLQVSKVLWLNADKAPAFMAQE